MSATALPRAPGRRAPGFVTALLGLLLLPGLSLAGTQTRTAAFEYDAAGLLIKEIPALCVVTADS